MRKVSAKANRMIIFISKYNDYMNIGKYIGKMSAIRWNAWTKSHDYINIAKWVQSQIVWLYSYSKISGKIITKPFRIKYLDWCAGTPIYYSTHVVNQQPENELN